MSYDIAPLILYSLDRTRMLNFLSDVFEFEVNEDDYLVFHQGMTFKVLNNISNQLPQESSVGFTFKISSKEEFEEIINKYNFFIYRRGQVEQFENISLFEDDFSMVITIKDIDLRPWRFELSKPRAA